LLTVTPALVPWHDASCTNPQLPSDIVIADTLKCAVVLEALKNAPSVGANAPPNGGGTYGSERT